MRHCDGRPSADPARPPVRGAHAASTHGPGRRDLRRERLALAVRSTGRTAGRHSPSSSRTPRPRLGQALPGTGPVPRRASPARRAGAVGSWPAGRRPRQRPRPRAAARRPAAASGVTALADRLWYPLWDAGLRLDHSVRTPAAVPRRGRPATSPAAVGLLDLRPLAGDAGTRRPHPGRAADRLARRHPAPPARSCSRSWPSAPGALRRGRVPARARPQGEPRRAARRHDAARAADELGHRPARTARSTGAHERLLDVRDALHAYRPADGAAAARRAGRGGRSPAASATPTSCSPWCRRCGPDRRRTPSTPPSGARGRRCRRRRRPRPAAAPAAPARPRAGRARRRGGARRRGATRRTIPVLPLRAAATAVRAGPAALAGDRRTTWPRGCPPLPDALAGRGPRGAASTCWPAAPRWSAVWEALDLAGLVVALAAGVGRRAQPAAAQRRPPAHGRPAPGRGRGRGPAVPARRRRGPICCCSPPCCTTSASCRAPATTPASGAPLACGPVARMGLAGADADRRRAAGPRAPHAGRAGHPA